MDTRLIVEHTQRGFGIINFKDDYGKECSLQKSSSAEGEKIWLGCDEIGLKRFTPKSKGGNGWEDIELEQDHPSGITHIANTRMHLTQDQVKALLPHLQRFADTGELWAHPPRTPDTAKRCLLCERQRDFTQSNLLAQSRFGMKRWIMES